jgi:hypothetical protein
MTAVEKAEYLIDIFVRDGYDLVMSEKMSKRCALIAVDEILNVIYSVEYELNASTVTSEQLYWQKVKHEIEKL